MSAALEVTGIRRDFGAVRALDDVSFTLERGVALGVIGPNGSGKTTLANVITGFLRPTAGRVLVDGRDVTRVPAHDRVLLGVARTFQHVRPFYDLPAYKNLVVPLSSPRVRRALGRRWGRTDEVAIDLLEEVGIERDSALPHKPASALPHGYLKRLELARCLALEPTVLILDELFSGMTLAEAASLVPVLEGLRRTGTTIVMIEHRLRELFRLVDRVLVLDFGKAIAEGAPDEVVHDAAVQAAYLGAEVAHA